MTARVEGDRVVLAYGGTGTLEVLDGAGDSTASDLGLTGTLAAGETRFGANVNYATAATKLSRLLASRTAEVARMWVVPTRMRRVTSANRMIAFSAR